PWAVFGISCMSPCAPLGDTALGLYPDSAWITAFTSELSTPYWREQELMIGSNSAGFLANPGSLKAVLNLWSFLMSLMKTLKRLSVGASVKWRVPSGSS